MKNDKKLKIAIVSDAIYPYNKGGKEKRIFEISTRLAKKGCMVTIYCMKWWGIPGGTPFQDGNERMENRVRLKAISKYYPLYSGSRRSFKEAIMFALSTFKLMREDFDIIEADHMPHLVLFPLKIVSILKRKKLYVTWNEVWGRKYWKEYLGAYMGEVAYLIEKLSALMPDKIIAVSEHTKKKLIADLKIKIPILVVTNGIDIDLINKVKPSNNKSDVIYAGRLLEHKNIDYLIRSISLLKKEYPNIKCLIVGRGPEEFNLKQITKNLKLENNIIFYDFLKDHQELYSLMKSSRVFVLPSTREGFGIAALEAYASGIPVITTDHKDNAAGDLVTNGKNGYKVSLNEKLFAEKIILQLKTKSFADEDSHSPKEYDWDKIASSIQEIYQK